MKQHDAAFAHDTKKALLCWRADEHDLRLFIDDAADERITVGGAFTIDDEK